MAEAERALASVKSLYENQVLYCSLFDIPKLMPLANREHLNREYKDKQLKVLQSSKKGEALRLHCTHALVCS